MNWARYLGIAVQAIVIGSLLYLAILRMLPQAGDATVFVYQGF